MANRNSNIELLRLVLMAMVIMLHFNHPEGGGAYNYVNSKTSQEFLLHFLESFSIGAVNCFMIVSGYFLYTNNKIKFGKCVDIFIIVIFYKLFNYGINIAEGVDVFSVRNLVTSALPCNYFAIFYVISYMLSPYIAKVWNVLSLRSSDYLIGILLVSFIGIPTILNIVEDLHIMNSADGLSPITIKGNVSGYTIVQFVVMLSLGMWIRKRQLDISSGILIGVYLVSSLIMTVSIVKLPSFHNYSSVFSVINAVCIFLLFVKLKFQNKIINYCAKSCFAIFCIHTSSFSYLLWKEYLVTESHLSTSVFHLIAWTFASIIVMFSCSLLISVVMRLFLGKVKDKICEQFGEIVI